VLVAGGVAVAVCEWLILRRVAKRDRMFPPLPLAELGTLIRGANTKAGFARLIAAERYIRLRRSVYFAGWRTTEIAWAGGAGRCWLRCCFA